MSRQEAICAKQDDEIVGVLLFSKENNVICFVNFESSAAGCMKITCFEKYSSPLAVSDKGTAKNLVFE